MSRRDSDPVMTKSAPPTPVAAIAIARRGSDRLAETRRASVSFAPLPSTPPSSRPTLEERRRLKAARLKTKGFRKDYDLGDAVRHPSHMVVESDPARAFRSADSLRRHDFAFVRRSDGSYSYAILAFRSLEPTSPSSSPGEDGGAGSSGRSARSSSSEHSLEECMAFVVNAAGSVKRLRRDQWGGHVRLTSTEGLDDDDAAKEGVKRRQEKRVSNRDEWVPPSIISFVPANPSEEDDLSLLD